MAKRIRTRSPGGPVKKSPYFVQPAKGGGVTVYRRPIGNRSAPTDCGNVPTQALAAALIRQLQRAESVLSDLFLEATDDGIEALNAVLTACRAA
ncbi:MAG: hypothetical protein M3081_20320, partial [Gemmatimonadota bacterium]|nr:hypothetical protein [Gemmatimonadota bacterium]